MSAQSATARLAMLVCLALFVFALTPIVPSEVFAFSTALLFIGLPVGCIAPGFDKGWSGTLVDVAIVGWVSWLIFPQALQTILGNSGNATTAVIVAGFAMFVYALLVAVIWYSLHRSAWLRRFSTVRGSLPQG